MSKRTNWFRHDYNARNDIKLQRLNLEFGLLSNGLYWVIVEIMHENIDNNFDLKEIEMLSFVYKIELDLLEKIISTMIKVGLFIEENGYLYSNNVLLQKEFQTKQNTQIAERNRLNGAKGGRPTKTQNNPEEPKETQRNPSKPKKATIHNNTLHNNTVISKDIYKESFEEFRIAYRTLLGGTVLGLETEFENFTKKYSDWEKLLPELSKGLEREKQHRDFLKEKERFVPEPKNLKTWINNRCWETEYAETEQPKPQVTREQLEREEREEAERRRELSRRLWEKSLAAKGLTNAIN